MGIATASADRSSQNRRNTGGTMYHAIVRKIARKNFERVNQKDYETLLADCVPNIRHRFGGSHAMGGTRHDRDALRRWFERLGRVVPTLHLTVKDVWVKG